MVKLDFYGDDGKINSMGRLFNKFRWVILFGMLILFGSCASNLFYAHNLRLDENITRPYKEALIELGKANDVDVRGMEIFLSDDTNGVVILLGDGSGIALDPYFSAWIGNRKIMIYSVIAHELAHKKLGHTFPSKENEFAADREAVRMLEKIGLWKDTYPYELMMEKSCKIVNKDGGKYHPSHDERIKRLEN